MANRGDTYSPEIQCIFVETNLDTNLGILLHNNETVFDIKAKIYKEHEQCYPEVGAIKISALKIKRRGRFFCFSDSMILSKAFVGITRDWFVYVDVVRVETNEPMAIMATDQKKKTAIESVPVDEHAKDLTSKEVLETDVAEKTTKKRKLKSVDRKGSRKKPSVGLNQTTITATTASRYVVDESHDVGRNAQVEVVASESGQKNDIGMEENQQTSVADRLCQEKILSVDADLVDGRTRGEVNDVQSDETLKKTLENDLAMRESNSSDECHKVTVPTENIKQDLGKGEKTAELVKIDQDKNLAPISELVDGHVTSRDDVKENNEVCGEVQVGVATEHCDILAKEKLDDLPSGAVEKDDERGEGSRLASNAADNLQIAELVTKPVNQLEVSSGPATEKKKKRKKSTKDQLEASSGLITSPATEKKKKKKARSSKDLIDQSTAATTISKEIVSDMEKVSASIERVDATSESLPDLCGEMPADSVVDAIQKETEVGEKVIDKVGSGEATLTDAVEIQATDNLQVADPVITPHALVEESKTLDDIGKITEENRALEHDTVKDHVDVAKSVKSTKKKTSKKAKTPAKEDTPVASGAQNVERNLGEGPDNVIRNVLDSLQEKNETQENLDKTVKKASTKSKKKQSSKSVESRGSVDVSLSSMKPKETNSRVQRASSGSSLLKSRVRNDRTESKVNHSDASVKAVVNNKKDNVKKSSNTLSVNKSTMNFFKDAENSSDDESKPTSHVSTKTPSYSSSDNDSDMTSNSRRQGNNTAGGTQRFSGSLQDILRSSASYKKAKLAAASQSQDVFEDESPALDFVPETQTN